MGAKGSFSQSPEPWIPERKRRAAYDLGFTPLRPLPWWTTQSAHLLMTTIVLAGLAAVAIGLLP